MSAITPPRAAYTQEGTILLPLTICSPPEMTQPPDPQAAQWNPNIWHGMDPRHCLKHIHPISLKPNKMSHLRKKVSKNLSKIK